MLPARLRSLLELTAAAVTVVPRIRHSCAVLAVGVALIAGGAYDQRPLERGVVDAEPEKPQWITRP